MTDQNPDTRAASMAQSGSAPSQSSLADALSTLMGNLTHTSPGAIPQKTGPRTAEEKAQREAFIANLRQIRNNAAAQMKDQYYGRDVRDMDLSSFHFLGTLKKESTYSAQLLRLQMSSSLSSVDSMGSRDTVTTSTTRWPGVGSEFALTMSRGKARTSLSPH